MKRIRYNAPVVLTFALISLGVLFLNKLTGGASNQLCFSVYRSSLLSPFTYIRLFGHVLGHANWEHYSSNMMMFLVLGPMLEERYGSRNILILIAVTAVTTGVVHMILFPGVVLLGASGIVFAFILLSSITGISQGEIPLTLIIVAVLYLGSQIVEGAAVKDNISQLSHVIGGVIGCICGYRFRGRAKR